MGGAIALFSKVDEMCASNCTGCWVSGSWDYLKTGVSAVWAEAERLIGLLLDS